VHVRDIVLYQQGSQDGDIIQTETAMPLLTLDITSAPLTSEQRTLIQQGLTQLMASVLDKVAGLTVVNLRARSDLSAWSVGGRPLSEGEWCASLHVAITEGSNSLPQQSTFLAAAHELLQTAMGQPPAAPLYIVMQNVPGVHWGYGGRTQASRQAPRASLALPQTIKQLSGAADNHALSAQGCVLLLLDFQREYEREGRLPLDGLGAAAHEADRLVQAADAGDVPVIHIHHVAAQANAALFDHNGSGILPTQKPTLGAHHLKLIKQWPSAFHDTALLQELRQRDIHTIVLAGCMTHNCVDSTARHALHLGFQVLIAGDACATRALPAADGTAIPADVVQRSTLAGLADRHATVMAVNEVVSNWCPSTSIGNASAVQ
jgi:nicotinamidase-related amidase/phenylpyruvate tautomerase PptA (4-oxalocrotonate tautomerase family)